MSCKKAIGVAREMKEQFGERLTVHIYTVDAEEAKPFLLHFRGSTNVRLNDEWVPLDIATDPQKMETFLSAKV